VEAIDRLTPMADVTLDLLLVHNGVAEPAPALKSIAASLRTPTTVVAEAQRGIPFARNRALDHADAGGFDYLAFIDDDAAPDASWLIQIVTALRESGADAVTGPQIPVFSADTSPRLRRARIFQERRETARARVNWAASNNVVFALRFAVRHGLRFNEDFATGGSDKEFFLRFHACGGVIVWTPDAIVREPVTPERLSIRWAVLRAWRLGTTGYAIERGVRSPAKAILICFYRGLRYCARGLATLPTAVAPGSPGLVDGLCDIAHGVGFILGMSARFRINRYV
jgi:glycosyltransferase involved in cell wall biosynthesis